MQFEDLSQAEGEAVHSAIQHLSFELFITRAAWITRSAHGDRVTYSRNVFIPLTKLCRDVCHYRTFAKVPRDVTRPYLSPKEVIAIGGC